MVNHRMLGLAAGIPAQSSDVPLERDAPATDSVFASRPRVAPESVGSGISFRRLPRCDFDQVRRTCQFYEAKGAGHYDAPSARYLYDLSREVQASVQRRGRHAGEEEQHNKVLNMFEQWNEVLASARTRLGVTTVLTPHMLLGMIDSSNQKITELKDTVSALQERNRKFENTIAESVDSQTVAVRTLSPGARATEQAHRKKVEVVRQLQSKWRTKQPIWRGVQLAYRSMEREKSDLMRSYNQRLEQAAQKLHATTTEYNSALDRARLEQQAA